MTNFDDLDPELTLQERSDPAFRHLISDLQNICSTNISAQPRADIARRLGLAPAKASATVAARGPILVAPLPAFPSRESAKAARCGLAALRRSGCGDRARRNFWLPAPPNSRDRLRRAGASAGRSGRHCCPPDQVIHEVTIVRLLRQPSAQVDARDITAEQWAQLAADGNPARIDLRESSANPAADDRTVADAAGNVWTYSPSLNTVNKNAWTPGKPFFQPPPASDPEAILYLPKQTMNAPQVPGAMRELLLAAAKGTDGQIRLLPQQSVDGATVDVVQVTRQIAGASSQQPEGWTANVITIYLDSSTYLIRRIDIGGRNPEGVTLAEQRLDITTYEILPASDVPTGVFTFTPPPGTNVCTIVDATRPPPNPSCTIARTR
jgi:hypothetical protein